MKPIEPGCLVVVIAGPFKELIDTVVTVIGHPPAGEFDRSGRPVGINMWIISSQMVEDILIHRGSRTMVANEQILRRIDDGDFDPAADGEENPYIKTVSHVWKPARQI